MQSASCLGLASLSLGLSLPSADEIENLSAYFGESWKLAAHYGSNEHNDVVLGPPVTRFVRPDGQN